MKKIITMLLFLPIVLSANTYYMNEDFESYTSFNVTRTTTVDTQGFILDSNWNCSNNIYNYHCSFETNNIVTETYGYGIIDSLIYGKAIKLVSNFETPNKYSTTSLEYNLDSPLLVEPNSNIIFEYDVYLEGSDFAEYVNINHNYAYAGFNFPEVTLGISKNLASLMGGIYYAPNTTTFLNWTIPKPVYADLTPPYTLPNNINDNMGITTGEWKHITMKLEFTEIYSGSNCNLTNIYLYNDGELIETLTTDYTMVCAGATQEAISEVRLISQSGWSIYYDNIELYTGDYIPESDFSGLLFCPYDNCIFYDGFEYVDGFNISNTDYTGTPNRFIVSDEILYPNSNGYIIHDIDTQEYNKVEANYIFDIFSNYTDINLRSRTLYYEFTDFCTNGNAVSDTLLMFDYYENTSALYSGYETSVNIYRKTSAGQLIGIGSMVILNGQNFGFSKSYDFELDKYYLNFYTNNNYETGILPKDTNNIYNFNSPCDEIDYFQIERGGNSNLTDFYGITELSYVGDFLTSDSGFDFVYINETKEGDDGVVDTEISEELHNFAYMIGFKSTASKILFWAVLIFIMVISVLKYSSLSGSSKGILSILLFILMLPVGWYLGFIPTTLFIFVILISSAVIGIAYKTIISGGE